MWQKHCSTNSKHRNINVSEKRRGVRISKYAEMRFRSGSDPDPSGSSRGSPRPAEGHPSPYSTSLDDCAFNASVSGRGLPPSPEYYFVEPRFREKDSILLLFGSVYLFQIKYIVVVVVVVVFRVKWHSSYLLCSVLFIPISKDTTRIIKIDQELQELQTKIKVSLL